MRFGLIFACLVLFSGCMQAGGDFSGDAERISVANWNVQTFFDAETDGSEYDEFVKSRTWGTEAYVRRLTRLSDALKSIDSDVVVMEELENEGVLHDICNFLAGEWDAEKVYDYACFAKDDGSSIGCGVLSRFPLCGLTLHALDVRSGGNFPRMRPLMELSVKKGGRELRLFVNHWKSMSGGENATEGWRRLQEGVLSRRMGLCARDNKAALACGDFNRDIGRFSKGASAHIVELCGLDGNVVEVESPWFDDGQNLVEPGSYYFNGEWSRIDNFFSCGPVEIEDFSVKCDGPWCNAETGIPEKYEIWSGRGYSDHLPIVCRIVF
ncbi:MAG TPA: hypothetical protein DCM57_07805 [Treponema sp.]|nr:hypothetical protein [Treponema sp.]